MASAVMTSHLYLQFLLGEQHKILGYTVLSTLLRFYLPFSKFLVYDMEAGTGNLAKGGSKAQLSETM